MALEAGSTLGALQLGLPLAAASQHRHRRGPWRVVEGRQIRAVGRAGSGGLSQAQDLSLKEIAPFSGLGVGLFFSLFLVFPAFGGLSCCCKSITLKSKKLDEVSFGHQGESNQPAACLGCCLLLPFCFSPVALLGSPTARPSAGDWSSQRGRHAQGPYWSLLLGGGCWPCLASVGGFFQSVVFLTLLALLAFDVEVLELALFF